MMILRKIAHPLACKREFLHESTPTPASINMFDLFEFYETMYDFNALAKKQKKSRNEVKALRFDSTDLEIRHCQDAKPMKTALDTLFDLKNKQLQDCDEIRTKTSLADMSHRNSLMKRCFRLFYDRVMERRQKLVNVEVAHEEKNTTALVSVSKDAHLLGNNATTNRTPGFEMKMLSFEDTLSSKFRENCSDASPVPTHLDYLHSQLTGISQSENEEFFAHGIDLEPTKEFDNSFMNSFSFLDQDSLKRLKREKLKAPKNTGANLFDVPVHLLFKACPSENDCSYIEYRLREKVQCLTELDRSHLY